jgi:hypothetical protein
MDPSDFEKHQISIERMTRKEAKLATDWAQKEGWNPGIHDLECFFKANPTRFSATKLADQIAGTVSAIKYSVLFAFEGLFI